MDNQGSQIMVCDLFFFYDPPLPKTAFQVIARYSLKPGLPAGSFPADRGRVT